MHEFEYYHGIVFSRMLHAGDRLFSIKRHLNESNSSYVIDENIGIYIKYSTKRLTPWRFSFNRKQYIEIIEMTKYLKNVFILFVCGKDGVVCLSFSEFNSILNNVEVVEWVSVARPKRKMYTVKGADGFLEFKIGRNEFPEKIFDEQMHINTHHKDFLLVK